MDERCERPLACPVCGEQLHLQERTFVCAHRHSFDVAREGYVNLLLGGGKRPKFQGDSKEMLQARRRFLEAGYYAPLAQTLSALVADHIAATAMPTIADIGCGEGWYMGQLEGQLADIDACFFGVDVAKTAVQLAAKRYPNAQLIVADAWDKVPFIDGSINVLLNIFAPRHLTEFARVLAADGLLLIVIPQPHHLQQLRHRLELLDIEAEKQQKVVAQLANHFQLQSVKTVEIEMDVERRALTDLVQMTPNYRHWTTADQNKLIDLSLPRVTAAFEILTFQLLGTSML